MIQQAAVITFPGHVFQTVRCLQSIQAHYPEYRTITVIWDDFSIEHWPGYHNDLQSLLYQHSPGLDIVYCRFSELPGLDPVPSGWWRQQLVKLHLDRLLTNDSWFVVDGDVFFETRCDIDKQLPLTIQVDAGHEYIKLVENYVQTLLGLIDVRFDHAGRLAVTNPIPFRPLTRDLLQGLRHYVEGRFSENFLALHVQWFRNQNIVAWESPPRHMAMSEWELIEHYRRGVLKQTLPAVAIGSGWPREQDLANIDNPGGLFRHSYERDHEIGAEWFRAQGINVPSDVWQRLEAWAKQR